jgi:hypothetical protein
MLNKLLRFGNHAQQISRAFYDQEIAAHIYLLGSDIWLAEPIMDDALVWPSLTVHNFSQF